MQTLYLGPTNCKPAVTSRLLLLPSPPHISSPIRYGTCGKLGLLGGYETCLRVARGVAENSSLEFNANYPNSSYLDKRTAEE